MSYVDQLMDAVKRGISEKFPELEQQIKADTDGLFRSGTLNLKVKMEKKKGGRRILSWKAETHYEPDPALGFVEFVQPDQNEMHLG